MLARLGGGEASEERSLAELDGALFGLLLFDDEPEVRPTPAASTRTRVRRRGGALGGVVGFGPDQPADEASPVASTSVPVD